MDSISYCLLQLHQLSFFFYIILFFNNPPLKKFCFCLYSPSWNFDIFWLWYLSIRHVNSWVAPDAPNVRFRFELCLSLAFQRHTLVTSRLEVKWRHPTLCLPLHAVFSTLSHFFHLLSALFLLNLKSLLLLAQGHGLHNLR